MNYYEELGLCASASSEQVRQAYLNLVRLLHPDQQQDENLRALAECQMKRLNQVYGVLSDPERRRRYDAGRTTEALEPAASFAVKPSSPPPAQHFGSLIWLGSAVLGIAGISWFITSDSGTHAPSQQIRVMHASQPDASQAIPMGPDRSEPARRTALQPERANQQIKEGEALAETLRSELRAVYADREKALQQIGKQKTEIESLSHRLVQEQEGNRQSEPLSRSALPVTGAAQPAPAPRTEEAPRQRFAGTWLYSRPKLALQKPSLYPPEYIETVIVEEEGALRGRYRARYQVADKAISPDVVFSFEGKAKGGLASLPWTGGGGSRGELQLRLVSENSLEVVWSASELGRYQGLTSGTAVLFRKPEP